METRRPVIFVLCRRFPLTSHFPGRLLNGKHAGTQSGGRLQLVVSLYAASVATPGKSDLRVLLR